MRAVIRSIIAAATLGLSALATAPSAKAADIVDIAAGDENFSTLVAAVQAAGLVDTLKGPGPFTVFAPTNAAFEALPPGTVETLLKPENRGQLTDILLYHVDDRLLVAGDFPARRIPIRPIKDDVKICVTAKGGRVQLNDGTPDAAFVVAADIRADNGVIHVIDKVLIPGAKTCGH